MLQVMVRYKVKPERVDENERLVRAVFEELRSNDPSGLRYATFRLDDGVSFVHVAAIDDGAAELAQLAAFRRFKEGLAERCDEPPVRTELREIGSFRAFA
jgi:hypothetical protein